MVGSPSPAAILKGDFEAGDVGAFSRQGLEKLASNRAGGVLLLRERVEVRRGKRLSRFVRREAGSVGDRDRPCRLAREPVAAASGVGGGLTPRRRLGLTEACPGRLARRSRFCHACRGGWFAFPATSVVRAPRGEDAMSSCVGSSHVI